MVVEVLLARNELLAVDRRREETTELVVGEKVDREAGQPVRLFEPAQLTCRDVQLVEPFATSA